MVVEPDRKEVLWVGRGRCREDIRPFFELLAANRKLATVSVLKDDLKHLWDYWHTGYARKFWKQWYNRAIRSRIEPLKQFARKLKEYPSGHPGSLSLAAAHQPAGRDQQQDQSAQADGLRIPRRRVLLPKDPTGLPRCWVMNRKRKGAAHRKRGRQR